MVSRAKKESYKTSEFLGRAGRKSGFCRRRVTPQNFLRDPVGREVSAPGGFAPPGRAPDIQLPRGSRERDNGGHSLRKSILGSSMHHTVSAGQLLAPAFATCRSLYKSFVLVSITREGYPKSAMPQGHTALEAVQGCLDTLCVTFSTLISCFILFGRKA